MAKLSPTKFRVSSALKTIIGKELITDDFIAVFELVKNSFDAHAKRVDIIFENISSGTPRLIIKDNGKGMDETDIVEKWLFVAYSAKKEGTEDYRDRIQDNRIFAGAKGIGRFSCDKLGSKLSIYTKKRVKESSISKLEVEWTDFERDSKEEFIKVPVKYNIVQKVPFSGTFSKGTILIIEGFREGWDREKLLKLKHSLEKLINPNQENDPQGFSIYLTANEEHDKDLKQISNGNLRNVVNGKIENRIFEDLKIKTTQIYTVISEDGKTIRSILEDRGTLIYEIEENNPYKGLLKDIHVNIFVLNRSAKITFHKTMGIRSIHYGSVFLYKNGFRIYPFGEAGQDTLKIDHRKQQGTSRFFGTRDIIGRIEINGENPYFQETSSRDGGLIRNPSYKALEEFFRDYVLIRLEKFAIGVIKWGNDGDLLDHEKISPQDMKKKVSNIVYNLTNSENLLNIEYNPKLINILEDRTERSLKTILNNFNRLAEQTDNQLVAKEIRRARRQYNSLVKAKAEAERESQVAKKAVKDAWQLAKQKDTENLFLQSVFTQDRKDILNYHHHIGIAAGVIEDHVKNLARKVRKKTITPEKIISDLQKISYQAKLVSSISRFATKANFKLKASEIKVDLISFIKEHLLNVCSDFLKYSNAKLKIHFKQKENEKCICTFRPIEVTVVIDNLLSNAKKAGASLLIVSVEKTQKDEIELVFKDNGKGIPEANLKNIFDLGFTTTSGSGLGLCHVKKILSKMQGSIKARNAESGGAEIIVKMKGKQ